MIGNKDGLHFIIGDALEGLHEVEIWNKYDLLTPTDKMVYLPQFIASLEHEIKQLESRDINPDGFFLNLGPTTDDCSCRIEIDGNIAHLSYNLSDQQKKFLSIDINVLISTYQGVVDVLRTART